MKKVQFFLLALATVCLFGLYSCKSTGEKSDTEAETEAVEETEVVEEMQDTTVVDTSAVME